MFERIGGIKTHEKFLIDYSFGNKRYAAAEVGS